MSCSCSGGMCLSTLNQLYCIFTVIWGMDFQFIQLFIFIIFFCNTFLVLFHISAVYMCAVPIMLVLCVQLLILIIDLSSHLPVATDSPPPHPYEVSKKQKVKNITTVWLSLMTNPCIDIYCIHMHVHTLYTHTCTRIHIPKHVHKHTYFHISKKL